jgi:hypothetical protein
VLHLENKQAEILTVYLCSLTTQDGYSNDGCGLLLTAYCAQGGTKFSTFDRQEFDYNISSCWHLLAKDCSGKSRFAILMRSAQNNETVNRRVTFNITGLQPLSFTHFIGFNTIIDIFLPTPVTPCRPPDLPDFNLILKST